MRHCLPVLTACLLAACHAPEPGRDAGDLSNKEQNLMSIAAAARASGNLDSAAELYRQLATQSKDTVEPHIELASLYRQQRHPEQAVDVLRAGQKLQPKNARLLSALGAAMVANNQAAEALAVFDEALAQDGKDISALNGKGVALDALQRHKEAQEIYRKALGQEAANAAVQNNLALSLILSDRSEEAIPLLERLTENGGGTATMRQNLAMAYGLKGDRAKAMSLGLKDLPAAQAEENLRFYEYYQNRHKNGAPTYQAVPVAPVELKAAETKPAATAAPVVPVVEEKTEEKPETKTAAPAEDTPEKADEDTKAAPVANATAEEKATPETPPAESSSPWKHEYPSQRVQH